MNNEFISFLNANYKENPQDIMVQGIDEEHFDGLCAECLFQTHQKSCGDDGVTFCPNCQLIEGKTIEMSVLTLNYHGNPTRVAYNWNSKTWSLASDEIGQEDL